MTDTSLTKKKKGSQLVPAIAGIGAAFGGWALISLLGRMDCSLTEMFRQYMVATGIIGAQDLPGDFYTQLQGLEYIIAVGFMGLFPIFFKHIKRTKVPMKTE